jgi:HK97 family phage prohead protease
MSMQRGVIDVDLTAARLKAAETVVEAGHRILEFYASAFTDEPDSNGDIMDPRAFDKWLPEFYKRGQALQISFNHAAMLDANDPTNVVGYAPADPDHVWVDDYGLRIKAFLDVRSEKGKAVEYQVQKKLLTGASLAFGFLPEDVEDVEGRKGVKRIKSVTRVLEAGLVPNPANQAAVLLWMKGEGMITPDNVPAVPYMTVDEFRQVIQKAEPDPLVVQAKHDELVHAGAVCAVPEALVHAAEALERQPGELTLEDEQRLRKLRFLEVTEL